ncbi:MAG: ATP-binding cassette domain-containing protein, partial [Devosia sp.]
MSPILEMRGITKAFGGVKALSDVSFSVEPAEIHAIVGENGAGKSTLMKVLSGVYPHGAYTGEIVFDGEARQFRDITESEALGIIIIHQELALIPLLTGADQPGREILHPVAVTIFGGLISATIIDTVLTPLLFLSFGRKPLERIQAGRAAHADGLSPTEA